MQVSFSTLKGHKDSVTCMLDHPMGLITGSEDRTVRIWDTRMNRAVKCICGMFDDEIACLSTYPLNDYTVCVGCEAFVTFYDLRNPSALIQECIGVTDCNDADVNHCCPMDPGHLDEIAICDDDGCAFLLSFTCSTVAIWNCRTDEETIILEGLHQSICTDVVPLTLNGKYRFYLLRHP